MGVDVFLGSVAAAGIGSAASSNLLCSQGLVKSSIAAAVSAKDKVTTAQKRLFSLPASVCCESKSFMAPGEGIACVWNFCTGRRPGGCPRKV